MTAKRNAAVLDGCAKTWLIFRLVVHVASNIKIISGLLNNAVPISRPSIAGQ
jgi:hypothetical protein